MTTSTTYDVVVVGAGVFGAWTAWHLANRKQRVLIVDSYGVAHSRASSGGESRIIRMGYGTDEIYTRWSQRSLAQWKELSAASGPPLFHPTGVLWLAGEDDTRLRESAATLKRCGIRHDVLELATLEGRYPQINFAGVSRGLLEPESGVLLARRAVASVLEEASWRRARFMMAHILPLQGDKPLHYIEAANGERFSAKQFVFACGPWLGKVFPNSSARAFSPPARKFFSLLLLRETRASRLPHCPHGSSKPMMSTVCRTLSRVA